MFRLGYGKAELYKVKVNLAACTSFSASLLSFVLQLWAWSDRLFNAFCCPGL